MLCFLRSLVVQILLNGVGKGVESSSDLLIILPAKSAC